jgi:AcrR family transcriptional regulator
MNEHSPNLTYPGDRMARLTQAHIDARRDAIRDAAQRLFVRKGVEGARMEEIAAEAGLSAGAIYRYFPSKEHLLRAVIAGHVSHNEALFHDASEGEATPLSLLLAKGRLVWEQLGTDEGREHCIVGMESALAAARYGGAVAEERRHMWRGAFDFGEMLLRLAQDEGEVDPTLDAQALSRVLLAAWVGLGVFSLDFGDELGTEECFRTVVQLLRRCAPGRPTDKEDSDG